MSSFNQLRLRDYDFFQIDPVSLQSIDNSLNTYGFLKYESIVYENVKEEIRL